MSLPQPSATSLPGIQTLRFSRASTLSEVTYVLDSMLYVESGELQISWRGRTHQAPAGSLVLLPAGERVDLRCLPGFSAFRLDSVQIEDSAMERFERQHRSLLQNLLGDAEPHQIVFVRSPEAARIWTMLTDALRAEHQRPMIEHWIHGVLLQLLLEGWTLPLMFRRELPLRRQVERLILNDTAHDWSAREIAARMEMSEPTLRRRLSIEGTSYRLLLEDIRMTHALELLVNGAMPIAQIASAVGYASASRFSIRFRSRYGISPRLLRAGRGKSANAL